MCGRYVRKKGKRAIAETFNVPDVPEFAMPDGTTHRAHYLSAYRPCES